VFVIGRYLTAGFVLALTAGAAAQVSPARPVTLGPTNARAIAQEIEQHRAEAQEELRSGLSSYFATIDRKDFGDRATLTVGRAADNDVRIDAPGVAAHHLRVTVDGDTFLVEAIEPLARFRVGEREVRQAVVGPSTIGIDRFTLRLSHQRFPAIIVFDPQSPRFKEYRGLKYFPVDLSYRYELRLTTNAQPETIMIMSTRGNQRQAQRVGWFDFFVGGERCRLEATRLLEPGVGENDVSVFFRDATSGKETYPLGRYVDAKKLPDGKYLLDFNAAYNPACAFSEHYNCPIPPKANTLAVAIRAGEMDSHYH
jgi:uncharacterized protein (DUF1684 family)